MRDYQIELEDGRSVSFSHNNEDLTHAEIDRIVHGETGVHAKMSPEMQQTYDVQKDWYNPVAHMGHGVIPWWDEIAAKMQSGVSGDNYDDRLYINRRILNEYRDDNPVLAPSLEVGGGILSVLGTGGASSVIKGAQGGGTVAQMAGRSMPNLMGRGAVEGGLWASGEGETPEERIALGAFGTVLGGATPLASYAMAPVVRPLARGAAKMAGKGYQKLNHAQKQVLGALQSDYFDPVLMRMRGKPETLADMAGENTKSLARNAAGIPDNEATSGAYRRMRARRSGQYDRLQGDITDSLGVERVNRDAAKQEIMDAARVKADALYQRAYDTDVVIDDEKVLRLLDMPDFRQAHDEVMATEAAKRNLALARGESVKELRPIFVLDEATGQVRREQMPTIETLDKVARKLRKDGYSMMRDGTTFDAGEVKVGIADALTDQLENYSGAFKEARSMWADEMSATRALERSNKFWSKSEDTVLNDLAALRTEGERNLYRQGAITDIVDNLTGANDGANLAGRLQNPKFRNKIRALVPDEANFNNLMAQLEREGTMAATENAVIQGSRTAPMAEGMKAFSDDGIVSKLLRLRSPAQAADVALGAAVNQKARSTAATRASDVLRLTTNPMNDAQQKMIEDMIRSAEIDRALRNAGRAGFRAAGDGLVRYTVPNDPI